MRPRQVRIVALREIATRLKSRAYQASTGLLVLLAVGAVIGAQALPRFFEDDPLRVGLVPAVVAEQPRLQAAADAQGREVEFVTAETPEAATAALDTGDLDAVVLGLDRVQFEDEVDPVIEAIVRQALFGVSLEDRAAALGLTLEEAQSLLAPVDVETVVLRPAESEGTAEAGSEAGQGIGQLSAVALLMAITFYGQWVLVGVIEEKSNRVVEVLLAAVRPIELLVGKVLGILALALLQILVSVGALVAAVLATAGTEGLPTIAVAGLGLAILWLVVGLLLYNFLYAAVGATVSRSEDATSVSFPLMVPIMLGYFMGLAIIPDNPDSLAARIISIFPLTAPLTMPSRVASGGGSPAEVILALVLAILALVAVIWLAGRIYSGGILQSSKVGLTSAFRRSRDIR